MSPIQTLAKRGKKSRVSFLAFMIPVLSIGSLFLQKMALSRSYHDQVNDATILPPIMTDKNSTIIVSTDRRMQDHSLLSQKLSIPVFVLSLPKSGTTTIQKYFNCGESDSAAHHWSKIFHDNKNDTSLMLTGECFASNAAAGKPMLQGCGDYKVWTDSGAVFGPKFHERCFFPSMGNGLENIAKHYPKATIIMVVRKRAEWLYSLLKWGDGSLLRKWQTLCEGFPEKGSREKVWLDFYENHTESVRSFASRHPAMTYIEVQLEDPQTPFILEKYTGVQPACWKKCRPSTGCQPSEMDSTPGGTEARKVSSSAMALAPAPPVLRTPVFVLSLPKSGTTFLQKYLNCGEFAPASHHWSKLAGDAFQRCLASNFEKGLPMLQDCGDYSVWTSAGGIIESTKECFYPSVHGLDNIASHYPNATILTVVRQTPEDWYNSLTSQGREMMGRWRKFCDGFPNEPIANRDSWLDFYDDHTETIRRFAKQHPSMAYVELSLESPETGLRLERQFGIPASCWPGSPEKNTDSAEHVDDIPRKPPLSGGISNREDLPNPREGKSLGRNKLPTPVLVLSLPKSGTTSMQKYFNCGQRKSASHHWSMLKDDTLIKNGACLGRNVKAGRPMLEGCGNFVAWADAGSIYKDTINGTETKECFFPSVHGLDHIASNYPNASILLAVRNPTEWYRSVKKWNGGLLLKQLSKFCTGFPNPSAMNDEGAWVAFYEEHTNSIRRFAKQHPTITYVEVSLESLETPLILEEKVGISGTCWGDCKPHIRSKHRCRFSLLNETWG